MGYVFSHLQRQYPGRFADGQLRTFQRRVKIWRASEGPHREVFFPQVHSPGILGQSDFTHMGELGITIAGQLFDHLIYHFVLTYSNWETGTICFSESFESLSEGLQNALWQLGGVPEGHQTDRLSTAVHKTDSPEEFTQRYQALLNHYQLTGRKTQPSSPNENGDIEQRHYRFKKALDQSLMLRGSRDFASRDEYALFLRQLFAQLNAGRQKRFTEEQAVLGSLPLQRLDACTKLEVRVGPSSTIRVKHNVYSVDSRLIRELVMIPCTLNIWKYGMGSDAWKVFPGCGVPADTISSIGISSTGCSASQGLLQIIVTGATCFQAAVSGWLMTPYNKGMQLPLRQKNTCISCIWQPKTMRRQWIMYSAC